MQRHYPSPLWLATLLLLGGCGGSEAESQALSGEAYAASAAAGVEATRPESSQDAESWIEYTITGDFEAEGRDVDLILCSETDEGWAIASRGAWTIDMQLDGTGTGQRTGVLQVTVPDGTEGAPRSVFARRMKAVGTVTIGDVGEGAMGFRKIEMEFSATGLQNDDGQTVGFSGRAVCLVF